MSPEDLFRVISIVNFLDYLYECTNINFHEHILSDVKNEEQKNRNFNPYNDRMKKN